MKNFIKVAFVFFLSMVLMHIFLLWFCFTVHCNTPPEPFIIADVCIGFIGALLFSAIGDITK